MPLQRLWQALPLSQRLPLVQALSQIVVKHLQTPPHTKEVSHEQR
jgi:hypothetical protein